MPNTHKVELIGQEVVAYELGVTSQAISNWYARAEIAPDDSHLRKMPKAIEVEYRPGKKPSKVWRRSQLPVWVKWHAKHIQEQGQHIPAKQRVKQEA
jgi:hypothetical protein